LTTVLNSTMMGRDETFQLCPANIKAFGRKGAGRPNACML
jgi:hypothetical protein